MLFDDSGFRNYFIRLFFVVTLGFTANKSIGMLSGILADSAGWQSVSASNVGEGVRSDIETFDFSDIIFAFNCAKNNITRHKPNITA